MAAGRASAEGWRRRLRPSDYGGLRCTTGCCCALRRAACRPCTRTLTHRPMQAEVLADFYIGELAGAAGAAKTSKDAGGKVGAEEGCWWMGGRSLAGWVAVAAAQAGREAPAIGNGQPRRCCCCCWGALPGGRRRRLGRVGCPLACHPARAAADLRRLPTCRPPADRAPRSPTGARARASRARRRAPRRRACEHIRAAWLAKLEPRPGGATPLRQANAGMPPVGS